MHIVHRDTNAVTLTAPLSVATYRRSHPLKKYTVSSYKINNLITADQAFKHLLIKLAQRHIRMVTCHTGVPI